MSGDVEGKSISEYENFQTNTGPLQGDEIFVYSVDRAGDTGRIKKTGSMTLAEIATYSEAHMTPVEDPTQTDAALMRIKHADFTIDNTNHATYFIDNSANPVMITLLLSRDTDLWFNFRVVPMHATTAGHEIMIQTVAAEKYVWDGVSMSASIQAPCRVTRLHRSNQDDPSWHLDGSAITYL